MEREFPALLGGETDHKQMMGESVTTLMNSSEHPTKDVGEITNAGTAVPSRSMHLLQFSAVVAGKGRRRATIGGGGRISGEKVEAGGTKTDGGELRNGRQQQRSGTISGMREDGRSYAQMLMKTSPK